MSEKLKRSESRLKTFQLSMDKKWQENMLAYLVI